LARKWIRDLGGAILYKKKEIAVRSGGKEFSFIPEIVGGKYDCHFSLLTLPASPNSYQSGTNYLKIASGFREGVRHLYLMKVRVRTGGVRLPGTHSIIFSGTGY
jgi:hypothetical protein